MHSRVLVIGDNIECQISAAWPDNEWWALGGRWTGSFYLKPGCTGVLGKRERPEFEDLLTSMMPEGSPRVLKLGGNADQARKGDIDFRRDNSPISVAAIVQMGVWIEPGEDARVADMLEGLDLPPEKQEDLREGRSQLVAWKDRVAEIIGGLPEETLLSIVDIHC
jgi:hypothetical protein